MDAVCVKGDWDVILEFDGSKNLIGVLVYHHRRVLGFNMIVNPPMTAYSGIHILYPDRAMTPFQRHTFNYKVTTTLIEQLPKLSLYYQQYPVQFDNWLALYWKGYKETCRYTYVMDTSIGKEVIWAGLKNTVQKDIQVAQESCSIIEVDMATYIREAEAAFAEKNKALPANKVVLQRLYDKLHESDQLHAKLARHKATGEYLSGLVVAKDMRTAYALASFHKHRPDVRTSLSYIMWDAMFERENQLFDFEGSILKGVEKFLRSFNATLTPHHRIYKVNNRLLHLAISILKPNFFG